MQTYRRKRACLKNPCTRRLLPRLGGGAGYDRDGCLCCGRAGVGWVGRLWAVILRMHGVARLLLMGDKIPAFSFPARLQRFSHPNKSSPRLAATHASGGRRPWALHPRRQVGDGPGRFTLGAPPTVEPGSCSGHRCGAAPKAMHPTRRQRTFSRACTRNLGNCSFFFRQTSTASVRSWPVRSCRAWTPLMTRKASWADFRVV